MEKICTRMSLTQAEEEIEIELELGLSIGGVYRKMNPVKDESLSAGQSSNSNSDPSEEENPSRSIGSDEIDQDTKREIHAARRKEAKRKRQEKRQVEITRCKGNKTDDDMNVNSMVSVQIPPLHNGQGDNAVMPDPASEPVLSLSRSTSSTGSENLSSRSHSNGSYPDEHHKSNTKKQGSIHTDEKLPNAAELSPRKPNGKSISKNTKETNLNKGKPPKPQTTKPDKDSFPYMPSVSTTGNGPNGKTINGFLYKYTKSEVSIICVCHGNTFSPAEFVQHAGGVDLSHPLKHINVIPSAF